MRIYEIAPGEKRGIDPYTSEQRTKLVKLVRKNCSQILKIYKEYGKFFYRGVSRTSLDAFKGASRNNRSTHTNQEISELISSYMLESGFKATRINSIACTSNIAHTEQFGRSFVIFPINGFAYTWSPKIPDFGIYTWKLKSELGTEEFTNKISNAKFSPDDFIKNELGYTDTDIEDALFNGNEINIAGEYYAISRSYLKDIKGSLFL